MFDVLGRRVKTVTDQLYNREVHRARWNEGAMPNGAYFMRMEVDGWQVDVEKMVRR